MTITITHPQSESYRSRNAVIAALAAVLVTIAGYAVFQTVTDDPSLPAGSGVRPVAETSDFAYGSTAGLAEWARVNGVSGLSPASAGTTSGEVTVGRFADGNGLSGLSPASLQPTR